VVSRSTVTLSWVNAAGTLGDDVYRDGAEVAWPGWPGAAVTSYGDAGVADGTHTYTVAGYNSSGVGPKSAAVTVTTTPPTTTPPATTPPPASAPSAPSALRAVVSGSAVTLSWSNAAGTLGDDIYRDGMKVAWPGWPAAAGTSYRDTRVADGTHTYRVSAYNQYGERPVSAAVTLTVSP